MSFKKVQNAIFVPNLKCEKMTNIKVLSDFDPVIPNLLINPMNKLTIFGFIIKLSNKSIIINIDKKSILANIVNCGILPLETYKT